MIVALGITTEGVKIPLGLWEGSSENATVATALLSDLVERGLDPEQGMLFVLDGSKALRKAVRTVFGEVPVQRCVRHKERNVVRHLAERDRPLIRRACAALGRRPTTTAPTSSSRGSRTSSFRVHGTWGEGPGPAFGSGISASARSTLRHRFAGDSERTLKGVVTPVRGFARRTGGG